jgi:hypothetical protein
MRSILRIVLVLVLAALPITAIGAPPAHFWSFKTGSTQGLSVKCMAVLASNGDFVATGDASGTSVNLGGPDIAIPAGFPSAWLARYNNRGQLKWGKVFIGNNTSNGNGVAFDATGNVYFAGTFLGGNSRGRSVLTSNGGADLLLGKFDAQGNLIWGNHFGGTGDEVPGTELAVDAAGNMFLSGIYWAATNLGGGSRGIVGAPDFFIAKYSGAGNWVWDIEAGSADDDRGYGIALDGSGNVYACGTFSNTISLSGQPLVSAGGSDAWLAKYSNDGIIQWSQRRGGTGDEYCTTVAADASGNVVLTGGFHNSASFGGSTLVSAGGYDMFLAKYNTSGVHQWSAKYGGTGDELGLALAVDSSGKIVLGGVFSSASVDMGGGSIINTGRFFDAIFAKYSSSGAHIWSRGAGGEDNDIPGAAACDVNGNAYVAGGFSNTIDLGGGNLTSNGQANVFFAKYGVAEPTINSIADVGNDQGRSVRITVARSLLDDGTAAHPVKEYQAFRRVLPLPLGAALRGGPHAVPSGNWEFVASVPASGAKTYRIITPTLADSTISLGMYRTKFYVRAATDDPVTFFDSAADSGYSKDNLAPSIPQNFIFNTGNLTWDESRDADFDYFTVYGSNTNSFGSATLINYSTTPAMDVNAQAYSYYYVTATDFSGNEGKPAIAHAVSGVGDGPGSYVLSVSAYPNPFNPQTTVRYTLPSRGHVTLAVYDLRGEKVATLVNREVAAGAYSETWRGVNDTGAPVSSGVYFAKLSTPAGERSYKMVLLK